MIVVEGEEYHYFQQKSPVSSSALIGDPSFVPRSSSISAYAVALFRMKVTLLSDFILRDIWCHEPGTKELGRKEGLKGRKKTISAPIRRTAGPIRARLLRYLEEIPEFVEPPEMVSEEEKYEDLGA